MGLELNILSFSFCTALSGVLLCMYVSKPRLSMDSSYEILDIAQQLSDLFVESLS